MCLVLLEIRAVDTVHLMMALKFHQSMNCLLERIIFGGNTLVNVEFLS